METLDDWLDSPTIKQGTMDRISWELALLGIKDPAPKVLGTALRKAGWERIHTSKGYVWHAPGVPRAVIGEGLCSGIRFQLIREIREIMASHQGAGSVPMHDVKAELLRRTGLKLERTVDGKAGVPKVKRTRAGMHFSRLNDHIDELCPGWVRRLSGKGIAVYFYEPKATKGADHA